MQDIQCLKTKVDEKYELSCTHRTNTAGKLSPYRTSFLKNMVENY